MSYFFVLAEQALFVLAYFWYVTLPIVAGVIAAFAYTLKQDRDSIDIKAIGGLAALFALPVIILALGVLYASPSRPPSFTPKSPHVKAGESLLTATLVFHLVVGLLLTWQLRQCIWVVLAVFLLTLEMSYAAAFISSMAISGDWL
jgi:hypothetical protein